MTEDKCPFCGAEADVYGNYKCGGYYYKTVGGESYAQTFSCKDLQISQLQEKLEAWRKDNIAWDCLAEMASDYYRSYKCEGEGDLRCGKCHRKKDSHKDNCLVNLAEQQLQKLRDLGEIQ